MVQNWAIKYKYCRQIDLSIHHSVSLSLSIHLSISMSLHTFIYHPSTHSSFCPSIHPSGCLSVYPIVGVCQPVGTKKRKGFFSENSIMLALFHNSVVKVPRARPSHSRRRCGGAAQALGTTWSCWGETEWTPPRCILWPTSASPPVDWVSPQITFSTPVPTQALYDRTMLRYYYTTLQYAAVAAV